MLVCGSFIDLDLAMIINHITPPCVSQGRWQTDGWLTPPLLVLEPSPECPMSSMISFQVEYSQVDPQWLGVERAA